MKIKIKILVYLLIRITCINDCKCKFSFFFFLKISSVVCVAKTSTLSSTQEAIYYGVTLIHSTVSEKSTRLRGLITEYVCVVRKVALHFLPLTAPILMRDRATSPL